MPELAQIGDDTAATGSDEPPPTGPMATCRASTPSSAATVYVNGARPIVQCEWSSSGLPPIAAWIAGISVRARSGVSKPAGSLR